MNKVFKNILFCFVIFSATEVSAKYFVEPHLGYIVTGSTSSASGANTYSGPLYGLKFGYYEKQAGFNFGVDVKHSTYTFATKQISSTASDRNEFGVFVGYNSQNKLRMWGGLYYTRLAASGSDYYGGRTLEAGAGYAVTERVSFNAYYRLPTYTSYNSNGTTTKYSPALNYSEMAIGVSFPYEL